jgi:hypothetical protein
MSAASFAEARREDTRPAMRTDDTPVKRAILGRHFITLTTPKLRHSLPLIEGSG